jgi:hypothetical protein
VAAVLTKAAAAVAAVLTKVAAQLKLRSTRRRAAATVKLSMAVATQAATQIVNRTRTPSKRRWLTSKQSR